MHLDPEEFGKITADCLNLFSEWEDQFEQFREILRDLAKKRGQEKVPLRINVDNKFLQERITQVRKFRRQHDELKSVIAQVLPNTQYGKSSGAEINAIKEINEAYAQVRDVDVLLLSKGMFSANNKAF